MTSNAGLTEFDTGRRAGLRRPSLLSIVVLSLVVLAGMPQPVCAAEVGGERGATKSKVDDELPLPPSDAPDLTPAEQYCSSIVDAASAAQFAHQKSQIEKAEKELDARVQVVVARTEELKAWIKRREEFTAQATDSLLQIYGKMKPESAAPQLLAMNEMVAAAILAKLSPKLASPILAEMEATKAARLSAIIAAAGEVRVRGEQAANAN